MQFQNTICILRIFEATVWNKIYSCIFQNLIKNNFCFDKNYGLLILQNSQNTNLGSYKIQCTDKRLKVNNLKDIKNYTI